MKPVLVDTGVIVALLDRSESHHAACSQIVRSLESPLVTCEAVIAESCYLLRGLKGASEAVIENVNVGIFRIPFQLPANASRVKAYLRKYRDRQIDLADACLICMSDEFSTGEILSLDQDFDVYRWGRNKTFRRMPEIA
jgi:predicted nucleic acid-binding protein